MFSSNSKYVAYVGALNGVAQSVLYASTLPTIGDPSPAVALTVTGTPAVQSDIAWLPGSRVILYRANDAGGAQLHAALLGTAGSALTSQSVSGVFGTGVTSYQIAP
jgi:hypothetical protein